MPNLCKDIEIELGFLQALEKGEVISQLKLSKQLRVSVGMVNALVKRAALKGYVKARSAPAKRYAYYLTPEGFSQKSRLVAEYIDISLHFFRNARSQYFDLFTREQSQGYKNFILYGNGELTEIAILAALEAGINIKGIVCASCSAERICGVVVVSDLEMIKDYDCIVLVDQREPQAAYDKLAQCGLVHVVRTPPILGVEKRFN